VSGEPGGAAHAQGLEHLLADGGQRQTDAAQVGGIAPFPCDQPGRLQLIHMADERGRAHVLAASQLAQADARRALHGGQQAGLCAGDAHLVRFATQDAVETQQHGAQLVGDGKRVRLTREVRLRRWSR